MAGSEYLKANDLHDLLRLVKDPWRQRRYRNTLSTRKVERLSTSLVPRLCKAMQEFCMPSVNCLPTTACPCGPTQRPSVRPWAASLMRVCYPLSSACPRVSLICSPTSPTAPKPASRGAGLLGGPHWRLPLGGHQSADPRRRQTVRRLVRQPRLRVPVVPGGRRWSGCSSAVSDGDLSGRRRELAVSAVS